MLPVARRRLLGATILFLSAGCQLVLGDFTLEGTPSEPVKLGNVCAPNTYRCTDNQLETCSDDRGGWTPVAVCASVDECDPTAGACRTCLFGEFACNGAKLQTCDATGHWQRQIMPCDSPELCHVAADRKSGTCANSPCGADDGEVVELPAPPDYYCSGNRLEHCSEGRDQLLVVDRCGSAALCDVAKAEAQTAAGALGTCQPTSCHFGQFACDGATLERCNDDQNGWTPLTTCPDAGSCNPLSGDCTPCSSGDTACSGRDLLRCGSDGFSRVTTCAAVELCNAAQGRCDKPTCSVPGTIRCVSGEPTQLEECGNDLRWSTREACASPALCSETERRCLPPACEPGETRCVAQELQGCSSDATHWVLNRTCAPNELCDPNGCLPAPCTEGSTRCNDSSFERCESGVWAPKHRCDAPGLCDKTQGCLAPDCDVSHGEYSCSADGILHQCTQGMSSEPLTCPPLVCDADLHDCVTCQSLAYECVGTELHRCLADGSDSPLVMNCPGGCRLTGSGPVCAQMP